MLKRLGMLLVLIGIVLLAGCESGPERPTTTSAVNAPATMTPAPVRSPATSTATVAVPTYPPTWTPSPTRPTPTPRPTVLGTYVRPTETPIIYPSYTPSPVPPSATPPGPVLAITADQINAALATEVAPAVGDLFTDPPLVAFQPGLLLIEANVLLTPGDITSARRVEIQAALAAEEGLLQVNKVQAYFVEDRAVYDTDLVTDLLNTTESVITDRMIQEMGANRAFGVLEVIVEPEGITIQTIVQEQ